MTDHNQTTDISGITIHDDAIQVVKDGPISWLEVKTTKCADQDCINKLITPFAKTILFKRYIFCSEKCAEKYEEHIKYSYRKSFRPTK